LQAAVRVDLLSDLHPLLVLLLLIVIHVDELAILVYLLTDPLPDHIAVPDLEANLFGELVGLAEQPILEVHLLLLGHLGR
jgi:hypothetical protein